MKLLALSGNMDTENSLSQRRRDPLVLAAHSAEVDGYARLLELKSPALMGPWVAREDVPDVAVVHH